MAQGRILTVHAWDPYHGDRNNRHPRLGASVPRRVPADLWRTFTQVQPALHNNGIFGWTNHIDTVDALERRHAARANASYRAAAKRARRVLVVDTEAIQAAEAAALLSEAA